MPKHSTNALARQVPKEVRDVLGEPPLVGDECKVIYWKMVAAFARFIGPDDFIAWMLVKDLADYRLEIHRLRRYIALHMDEAWRDNARALIYSWKERIVDDPAKLRSEAEKVKKNLEKSGKPPEEVKKLIKAVEGQLKIDCQKAEEYARGQVEAAMMSKISEIGVAVQYRSWIRSQEVLEPLLERAETKFSDKLVELERHLRGFANLILDADTIEGVIADAKAVAPSAEKQKLEHRVVAGLRPTESAPNPAGDALPTSAVGKGGAHVGGRAA